MFAALLRLIWEKAVTDDDKRTERQRRDAEVESRAATAYDDLFTHKDRNDWAKWMFIADGLMVGRRWALAKAGTQEPVGRGYNTAFSQWMATRHWARDLDKPTRNHLFWCADHRSEIEAWRDELPPQERVKICSAAANPADGASVQRPRPPGSKAHASRSIGSNGF